MNEKDNQKMKYMITVMVVFFIFLIFFFLFLSVRIHNLNKKTDEGYDYCVEWIGFNEGILHRDNLLYTCYNLGTNTFYCDYKVMDDGKLMIKPILNTTKNEEGEIMELIYDEPIYHNCTRWLKSKR